MKKVIFNEEAFEEMKQKCKEIVRGFCSNFDKEGKGFDTTDIDCEVEDNSISDEEIKNLFEKLCDAMNLSTNLGFFRDDYESGRYYEATDTVSLPLWITYYPTEDICRHMTHELFHAFQYYAINNPSDYPCFDSSTIAKWKYEFKNYYNGTNNTIYANQEIEKTAREFAKQIVG